jgi:hypothetical protein
VEKLVVPVDSEMLKRALEAKPADTK